MLKLMAAVLLASATVEGASERGRLDAGIQLYDQGMLEDAVQVLTTAAGELASAGDAARPALVKAWTYKGAAHVGLYQEELAKQCFREALRLQPTLELTKRQFPDRVARVFEAARSGKSTPVMERPNTAPKKAGIGAVTIGLIAGAGALVAGGAAAAVSNSNSSSTPSPTPTTAPGLSTAVVPNFRSGESGAGIDFLASSPGPGSVISGCGSRCAVDVGLRITSNYPDDRHKVTAALGNRFTGSTENCAMVGDQEVAPTGSRSFTVGIPLSNPCSFSVLMDLLTVHVCYCRGTRRQAPCLDCQHVCTVSFDVNYRVNP